MKHRMQPRPRLAVLGATTVAALATAASASAHAHVFPETVEAKSDSAFTIWVPTEKENTRTTTVEVNLPDGFAIDSFGPSPGWQRRVIGTGSGENRTITKVVWTALRGGAPTDEAATFTIAGAADSAKDYAIPVRQVYSNGDVEEWSGSPDSDTPAPVVNAVSSIGGGGSSSTLAVVALVVGAVGIVIALVALLAGRRSLA